MRLLGVGSNMVTSLRFWARSCELLDKNDLPTALSESVFGPEGIDPFCEDPTTIWLLHWNLAKNSKKLTPLWFLFNVFTKNQFSKQDVQKELDEFLTKQLALGTLKHMPTVGTLDRDIDTILRSYAPRYSQAGRLKLKAAKLDNSEEAIDALFTELGLIDNNQQSYYFNRGKHLSLSPYLFAYCYLEFWEANDMSPTLDLNRIAYQEGSPGRVFKLDELSLEDYLTMLEEVTQGDLKWTEQTGLRHVVCNLKEMELLQELKSYLLTKAYGNDSKNFHI